MRPIKTALYIDSTGTATGEHIKGNPDIFDLPDGFHAFIKDGIYRDDQQKYSPIMIFYQDTPVPEGVKADKEMFSLILKKNHIIKEHKGRPAVSRRFLRGIVNNVITGFRFVYLGFFLAFLGGWMMIFLKLFGMMFVFLMLTIIGVIIYWQYFKWEVRHNAV